MRFIMLISLFASLVRAESVDSTGTVQGTARYRRDGSPAAYANIIIIGTRRGTQADEQGRFRIDRVPPGRQVVRTLLPGAEARSDTVEVHPSADPVELRIMIDGLPPPAPVRVGVGGIAREEDLVTTIQPIGRFHVGEQPLFKVRIRNRGSKAIVLVRAVEGSDRGMSPAAWIAIVGPPDGWPHWGSLTSGKSRGVQKSDFVEVPSGASFDPLGTLKLTDQAFRKPGRYTATFRYQTTATGAQSWGASSWPDRNLSTGVRELLERVPAVDLIALTTFDVAP